MSPERSADLTFSVNMPPKEANAREEVAKQVDGVTFLQSNMFIIANGDTMSALPGHVIGQTSAESEEALKEFNIRLNKIYPFIPHR